MIKTLTVLGAIFGVFLLKGNTSLFRFNTPSRVSLLHQIDELKHDLESYEKLKKTYVDDAVQLSWDKQHIIESENVVHSMMNSSIELSQHFYEEEQKLLKENEHAQELVAELSRHASDAVQLDHEAMRRVSREIEKSYSVAQNEHQKNVALRRQIAETMKELKRHNIAVPEHILQRLVSQHLV
jgi:cell division septum initiation protein DivIVA